MTAGRRIPVLTDHDEIELRIQAAQLAAAEVGRFAARAIYAELWDDLPVRGHPWHRCLLAHLVADVQDSRDDEFDWDMTSLRLADSVWDEADPDSRPRQLIRARQAYSSIYLSLAQCQLNRANLRAARTLINLSAAAAAEVPDSRYRDGLVTAILDCGRRIRRAAGPRNEAWNDWTATWPLNREPQGAGHE